MTAPLIDRAALERVIRDEDITGVYGVSVAVLAYLRSVLTPEALRTVEQVQGRLPGSDAYEERIVILIGADLHHRIFGEDQ